MSSATAACPDCGSTSRDHESGDYVLFKLTQGKLEINLDPPGTTAVVVGVETCSTCKLVFLRER